MKQIRRANYFYSICPRSVDEKYGRAKLTLPNFIAANFLAEISSDDPQPEDIKSIPMTNIKDF